MALVSRMIRFSTRPSALWHRFFSLRFLNVSASNHNEFSDFYKLDRGRAWSSILSHRLPRLSENDCTVHLGYGNGEKKKMSSSTTFFNCLQENIVIESHHTRTHLTTSSQVQKCHHVMINLSFVTNINLFQSLQSAFYRHQQMRSFASKVSRPGQGKKKRSTPDDTDSSDDDDEMMRRDGDDLERDWDPELDEKVEAEDEDEDGITKDWKDIRQHVPSLRMDAVLSAGLGVSRKKIEEAYLSMRLKVNGERVAKKSRQVKEGDILDFILERSTPSLAQDGEASSEGTSIMRLQIKEISTDRTGKDRIPVLLRRWKNLKVTKEKK